MAKKKQSKTDFMKERIISILKDGRFRAIVLYLLLVAGILVGIRCFLFNNSFFVIRKVAIEGYRGDGFPEARKKIKELYLGRNIFSVDLDHASMMISGTFPQLKKVQVCRVMPDTLSVSVTVRKPVAVIGSGGGIMIDKEAVVVEPVSSPSGLVRITGISFFLHRPKAGEKLDEKRITRALSLLDLMERTGIVGRYHVERIDVSGRNDVQLEIEGVLVKMGDGDFVRRVKRLKEILDDPAIDLKGVEYIDLRFDEPVISPK